MNRILSFALLVFPGAVVAQGPLDPPPGGPQPSMKTLQQVESRVDLFAAPPNLVETNDPDFYFVIKSPGSYYLSRNASAGGLAIGAAAKPSLIRIDATGVTVDLNGFQLRGAASSLPGAIVADHAVSITGGRVRIVNGNISRFRTAISGAERVTVEGVRVDECGRGFDLGDYARVSGCEISDLDAGIGIAVGYGSLVESCVIAEVRGTLGAIGIKSELGSRIDRCVIRDLAATTGSSAGISCSGGSVTGCTVSFLRGANPVGILVRTGSSVKDCAVEDLLASAGSAIGISTTNGASHLEHCRVRIVLTSDAGTPEAPTRAVGILTTSPATLVACSVDNAPTGFELKQVGTLARGCHALSCPVGFVMERSAAYDCGTSRCTDGFHALGGASMQRCFTSGTGVAASGGKGFWVTNRGNRVENCTATSHHDNIFLENAFYNFVLRNTLTGATGDNVTTKDFTDPSRDNLILWNAGVFSISGGADQDNGTTILDPANATNPLGNFDLFRYP